MNIHIQTIPHDEQRYPTVGDYWTDADGTRHIVVSDMANDDYAFLVALHELIEQKLCEKRGISEQAITDFDIEYEKNRPEGNDDEPGFDAEAPYKNEHTIATAIEMQLCATLNIDWKEYERAVNSLP